MTFNFEFTIQDISLTDAQLIMETIVAMVENAGGQVGGGFNQESDDAQEDA